MASRWLIIRAATRMEKRAIKSLKELGLYAWTPMRTVWDQRAKERGATKQMAALPGYVFVLVDEGRRLDDVVAADGVHGFFWTTTAAGKKPASAPDKDVIKFIEAEASGALDETKPKPKREFSKGQKLRITEGPWTGWVGEVIEARGEDKVSVFLTRFGNLTLGADQVEDVAPVVQTEAA
jgi:transcription termination/antitermination protein NusG